MLLSLPAFVVVSALVLGVMLAGFAGRPAPAPYPFWAWALLLVGVAGLVVSTGAVMVLGGLTAALTAAGASCAIALSAWLLRAGDDGGAGPSDDDGPSWGDEPPGGTGQDPPLSPGPWDWADFDGARERWGRTKTL